MTDTLDQAEEVAGSDLEVCPECGREFRGVARKLNLGSHMKKHARDRGEDPGSKPGRKPKPAARRVDRSPRPPGGTTTREGKPSLRVIETELRSSYELLAFAWSLRDPVCGPALAEAAPTIAKAWVSWAESNAQVRAMLERMMVAAGALGVISAHVPFLLVVGRHHGPAARQMEGRVPEPGEQFDREALLASMPPEVRAMFDQLGPNEQEMMLNQAAAMFAGANGSAA